MDYTVSSIDTFQCKSWLLKKHYAKRIPAATMFSFGLMDTELNLLGVCTFGNPPRAYNEGDFAFKNNYSVRTVQLTRLVINEELPKNTLSFFVSKCLNLLPKPMCVVSYADPGMGHNGYIYQATNWMYTGLNPSDEVWMLNGKVIHTRTLNNKGFTTHEKRAQLGLVKVGGTFKHRYFYFLGSKRDIKKMKEEFALDILPYPKGDNTRYDASYAPTIQKRLFL